MPSPTDFPSIGLAEPILMVYGQTIRDTTTETNVSQPVQVLPRHSQGPPARPPLSSWELA